MTRSLGVALAAAALVASTGCKSSSSDAASARPVQSAQTEYQRIAIVCAPAPGADAQHAVTILEEAKIAAPVILGRYLKTVDFLPDVAVETKNVPPKAELGARAADYDGVCCLVYSYGGGNVVLDMYMLNVKSGQSVWNYRIETADPNIKERLRRHGHYVPSTLKAKFYRFD